MTISNEQLKFYPKTVFFEACRGVFEGGGCRAAAHVGSYCSAIKCGINFSEVAGTSAGSIVAALVGGGASPDFLEKNISNLNFTQFLANPEKNELSSRWWMRLLGRILRLPLLRRILIAGGVGNILLYGGLYSSSPIEEWLDQLLHELLPNTPRPVLFKDLILPTRIVATDLVAGEAKVWGSRDTPNERVSFAVRCSCSIPGFFQPVSSGMNRYVDGGVLSNLPSFVFSESMNKTGPSLGGPILAFRLEEDFRFPRRWSVKILLNRLLSTVVSGATELQIAVQGNVHVVSIPTGKTRATDFQTIQNTDIIRLQHSGEQALIDFINDEAAQIREVSSAENSYWDIDELDDALVRAAQKSAKTIYIAEKNTKWFWRLFPSVLHWRSNGTQVKVLASRISAIGDNAAREQQRRDFLTGMGAELREEELPISGYFIRREDNNHDAAIIIHQRGSEDAPKATSYIGSKHREVIESTCNQFCELFSSLSDTKVKLQSESHDEILRLLKNVGQYMPPEVTIDVDELQVDRIELITRYIRSYKYRQIAYLAKAYDLASIPYFATAAVYADSNRISTVTPPVIEEHGKHMVAIEGNTRVYYCNKNKISTVKCIVVRGVREPLPGRPIDPRRVILSTRRMQPTERIEGFNYDRFRSIEGAIRPVTGE